MTLSYTLSPWKLTDLFPAHDSPEMEAAIADLQAKVAEFESVRSQLTVDIPAQAFLDIVKKQEDITSLVSRIYAFAGLSFSANTQDQALQTFRARVDQLVAGLDNRTLFFSLWWKEQEDAVARRLIAGAGDYRYWLEAMRYFKPHTLTEPEEKIINIKNVTGARAIQSIYDTITNRYLYKMSVDGELKELTRGELMVYARHHDPALRAAAYQELYRVFGQDANILGQMYQALVRDWHNENLDLRHFASPIAARNLGNDIPDDVVDTLLDVCQSNAALFQRFFRLKAKWLGMERLRRYDIYAPVVKSDKTYPFITATEKVFESFERFDPRLAALAQRVLEGDHLDSEVRRGKRGGAFCWSVTPDLTPWVLVNYQGRSDDIATLAHELGHAIHSMLASGHSTLAYQASLPLAETASTFGEMMLVDRLLAGESDEAVRRDLLFRQVDDAYATIMRQAYFALFERQAHTLVNRDASTDELAEAYLVNLRDQFGDSVEVGDEFRWEWVSIPPIFETPFYVYAYTFGQLLVLSLYKQYQKEGETFKPRYLKILAAGGSDSPERVLTEAGIDIHSASFWQGGFDVIHNLIEQLEALPVG